MTLAVSVAMRNARMNSSAVDESKPRVELGGPRSKTLFYGEKKGTYLSQQTNFPRADMTSAIDTLFFSPPEMPLRNASPTTVSLACSSPNMRMSTSAVCVACTVLDWLSDLRFGVLIVEENSNVSFTLSVGKWTSSSGQYMTSPRYRFSISSGVNES